MNYDIEFFENDNLPDSVIDFLNYLETIKNKSSNTIAAYKKDLTIFFRFMKLYRGLIKDKKMQFEDIDISDVNDEFLKSIKLRDLYAFMSFIEKHRNNSAYARARKVATLKSYFKFLQGKAKVIVDNPTIDLESPKINKRHPVYLTLDQSIHLLSSLDKNDKNYARDYCILTLFLNCGMRLSELCSISIEKIRNDILTIIGKGNKERTVYLNEACLKSIKNYMKIRDTSKVSPENKKFLFLSSHNKPINQRTVEIMIKKHIQNAGFTNEKYTPHKLRHSATCCYLKRIA